MASKKKVTKQEKQQDNIEDFVALATDLKEIVLSLNQRVSEMESIVNKMRQRMGL